MDPPEKHGLLDGNNDTDSEGYEYQPRKSTPSRKFCLYGAFAFFLLSTTIVSMAATIVLFLNYHTLGGHYIKLQIQYANLEQQKIAIEKHIHVETSAHAGLIPEIPATYYEKTPYNDLENQDLADELWDSIDFNAGIVALSDDYAKEKGLPIAQRFPWDQTKGIYLLNGHHHLHCLKSIHGSLVEYRKGLPQSRGAWHVYHCLDALRREIICNADDTPRASTTKFSPNTGVDQFRQCRSWQKLESWAALHTACYKYVDPHNKTMSNLERFKYCPKDSPYWQEVRKVYPDAGMDSK